jgi:SAM-dependent methyltransferase
MDQTEVDARIQTYYASEFDEDERLTVRSAQGRLERERTQELVTTRIPAGSRVLDVGGATGIHAVALAAAGHEVLLVDPVPEQVRLASLHGTFEARVGDARNLPCDDGSYDVALLLGPLYHLGDRAARLQALSEAARVVRRGGWVFAAAIPRVVRHAALTLGRKTPHPYPADRVALLEHGHAPAWGRFPGAHFHTAEELEEELRDSGLVDVEVCAVEGPDGLAFEHLDVVDEDMHLAALRLVRMVGHLPGVRDLSNHVMGTARVAG